MDELQRHDVPYGNDWDSEEEVAILAEEADRIRPWRGRIRDRIARIVATLPSGARVLELGSGPGFLAHRVLQERPERILICDHTPFDDSPTSTALYMTEQEQREALTEAGFTGVRIELRIDSLVLYAGDRAA